MSQADREGMGEPADSAIGPTGVVAIPELLEELAADTGLTAIDLARLLGVSRRTLYNWQDGTRPSAAREEHVRFVRALCDAYPVGPTLMRAALLTVAQGRPLIDGIAAGMHPEVAVSELGRALGAAPIPGKVTWPDAFARLTPAVEPIEYFDIRAGIKRATRYPARPWRDR